MTTITNYLTVLFIAVSLLLITSCRKQDEGCAQWKEGENCEIETRSHFYGTYAGTATSGGTSHSISTKISADGADLARISFDDGDFYGVISSGNSFTIPAQTVDDGSGPFQLEGSGSLNGNQLTTNFILTSNGQKTLVNFKGTK